MGGVNQYIVFHLDERKFALHLSAVERIILAVEVTPLPEGPEVVLGVVNIRGRVIPVVNTRKRFRLPEREVGLSDQFIIARTSVRTIALVVDAVDGVIEQPGAEVVAAGDILPEMDYVDAVAKLNDGMVPVLNLDRFLPLECWNE